MPYVGNPLADAYSARQKQDLTGQSGTTFTLTHAVSSPNDLSVYVNHVRQEPTTAYTVNGTTLTTTGSVAASDDFYIIYDELAIQSISHPTNQALTATAGTFTSGLVGTTATFSGALSGTTGTFSGDLTIDTSTLKVDAANNRVGIGTSAADPARLLTLYQPSDWVIIALQSSESGTAGGDGFQLQKDTSNNAYVWNYENANMNFATNNTNRMTIGSGGDVDIETGDIFFSTAGKGICLGVTSNTDANTLDDYEEGTFTPALKFGGTSGTDNTDTAYGQYTKVGDNVTVSLQINLDNTVSGSGAAVITGMPFAFVNNANVFQKFKMFGNDYMISTKASAGGSTNNTHLDCYLEADATSAGLASFTNTSVNGSNSGKKVMMAFTYKTN